MTCQAVKSRMMLTGSIREAARYSDLHWQFVKPSDKGTQQELLNAFSVLHGIVNEYLEGGDQMVEECTCGEHRLVRA